MLAVDLKRLFIRRQSHFSLVKARVGLSQSTNGLYQIWLQFAGALQMPDSQLVVADLQQGFTQTELIVWIVGLPGDRALEKLNRQFVIETKSERAKNIQRQRVLGRSCQDAVA